MDGAVPKTELGDVIAELADIRRQSEAWIVAVERHIATLRLHRDDLQRELACSSSRTQTERHRRSCLSKRTGELVFTEAERSKL